MTDITNAASSIEKFHFIKDSKLPSLKPNSLHQGKLQEIEEKVDEDINNLSDEEAINEALAEELDEDDLMEE